MITYISMCMNILLIAYIVYLKTMDVIVINAIKECSDLIKEARELDNDNTK